MWFVRRSIVVAVFFLLALPVLAELGPTATFNTPVTGAFLTGNVTLNITYNGTANVTLEYNNILLNSTVNDSNFTFIWETFNGSFADGLYTLTVNITNATNVTDNVSITVNNLLVDNEDPVLITNTTSNSSPAVKDNVTFSVLWDDISLLNETAFNVTFEKLVGGVFTSSPQFSTWTNSMLGSNYTNNTYHVNGSDEGLELTFRVVFNDSQGRANFTENLTVYVQNTSPVLTVTTPLNNTDVDSDENITIEVIDIGSGVNLPSLTVTANATITYGNNASLFNCSNTYANNTDNQTCTLDVAWVPEGNNSFTFSVADNVGNTYNTTYFFNIVNSPDIVNLTINNQNVTGNTISITNASQTVTFNWTIDTLQSINTTIITLTNITYGQITTLTTLPAGTELNLTAGLNFVTLNVTLNNSDLSDTVNVNVTANVPLNITAISDQYTTGMVTSWSVFDNGTNITNQTQYVNGTYDFMVSITNETHQVPFSATFNYTTLDGLLLRWNATDEAFDFRTADNLEASLSATSASNVTLVIEHVGMTELFFNNENHLLEATFNFSLTNMSAYYQHLTDGGGNTYGLQVCSSTPTSSVTPNQSCYVDNGNTTTLYLTRFQNDDRIFFGEWDEQTPDITIFMNPLQAQSTVPIDLRITTPNPNATFCSYNLSAWNGTNGTIIQTDILSFSEFVQQTLSWNYFENVTGMDDGQYNLSVTCADNQSEINSSQLDFNVSDTTLPTIYIINSSDLGSDSATITGTADELVNFTVYYGTESDNLTSSLVAQTETLSMTIEITGLTDDTKYYYNVSGCDAKNQCNSSSMSSFTTTKLSSSSSGGSGGSGGATGETIGNYGAEATDSRVWVRAGKNFEVDYEPTNIIIKRMMFFLKETVDRGQLTIKQYPADTDAVTKKFDGSVYKYVLFEHAGLKTVVDSYEFSFGVESEWLGDREIGLYRLEDTWVEYPTTKLSGGDEITFTATVPDLSWWAIGSATDAPTSSVVEDTTETNVSETTPVETQPETPFIEGPTSGFISDLKDTGGIHIGFLIAGGMLIIILCVIGGMKGLQIYKQKEIEHEEVIKKEHEAYTRKQHGPFAELHRYIEQMRKQGFDTNHIKKRLASVGWDSVVIDQELGHSEDSN